jgi:hypothetical protein
VRQIPNTPRSTTQSHFIVDSTLLQIRWVYSRCWRQTQPEEKCEYLRLERQSSSELTIWNASVVFVVGDKGYRGRGYVEGGQRNRKDV